MFDIVRLREIVTHYRGSVRLSKSYVYADDSAFLGNYLFELNASGNLLEIGTGRGGVLRRIAGKKTFEVVVGTDIAGLEDTRKEISRDIEFVRADRASCFRGNTFDLIITNPPYVPTPDIRDISTDGGAGGIEVPLLFLESALEVMKSTGRIIVLLSSEDSLPELYRYCGEKSLDCKKVAERSLFFEVLYLFEIKNSGTPE